MSCHWIFQVGGTSPLSPRVFMWSSVMVLSISIQLTKTPGGHSSIYSIPKNIPIRNRIRYHTHFKKCSTAKISPYDQCLIQGTKIWHPQRLLEKRCTATIAVSVDHPRLRLVKVLLRKTPQLSSQFYAAKFRHLSYYLESVYVFLWWWNRFKPYQFNLDCFLRPLQGGNK